MEIVQDDLELVRKAGGGHIHITVGSALDIFGGTLPYKAVVEWHKEQLSAL
jgi:phosphoribosylformimino-5-aminoimidazole carboxamide ribotide isomerase